MSVLVSKTASPEDAVEVLCFAVAPFERALVTPFVQTAELFA